MNKSYFNGKRIALLKEDSLLLIESVVEVCRGTPRQPSAALNHIISDATRKNVFNGLQHFM